MTNRKQPLEPLTMTKDMRTSSRLVVDVRWVRAGVDVDLLANAALRWLCRDRALRPARVVSFVR